jgi:hypothetical protein
VYLHKENPCSRTVCSHYNLDAREYMSDPSRPKPYQPRGAIDGNICDTALAKNMSFCLRYGDSCGIPFWKDEFCDEQREWAYLRPYLHDRPQQPWTIFSITNTNTNSNTNSNNYTKMSKIKMNKIKNNKNKNIKSFKNTTKKIFIKANKKSRSKMKI